MIYEVNNKKFKDGLRKHKGSIVPIKNNPNKAFIAKLKKQILSNDDSSSAVDSESDDTDAFSEELMKELEAKFDELFADLDDDDD